MPSGLGASLWAPMRPVSKRSRAGILGSARSRYATLSDHAMGRWPDERGVSGLLHGSCYAWVSTTGGTAQDGAHPRATLATLPFPVP